MTERATPWDALLPRLAPRALPRTTGMTLVLSGKRVRDLRHLKAIIDPDATIAGDAAEVKQLTGRLQSLKKSAYAASRPLSQSPEAKRAYMAEYRKRNRARIKELQAAWKARQKLKLGSAGR